MNRKGPTCNRAVDIIELSSHNNVLKDLDEVTARCSHIAVHPCEHSITSTALISPGIDLEGTDRFNDSCGAVLSEGYFQTCISKVPVVRVYASAWDFEPANLQWVCGTGSRTFSECSCAAPSFINAYSNEHGMESEFSWFLNFFKYMVPEQMPYMMHMTEKSGPVCATPFYSIICRQTTVIPKQFFMMHQLSFDRVITNPIFRHELAFDPGLYINAPPNMSEESSSSLGWMWTGLACEVADLNCNTAAYGPIAVLPHFISGIKALMLSVLPGSLAQEINSRLSLKYLLSGSVEMAQQFYGEFSELLGGMLEACVLPMRIVSVEKMKSLFTKGFENSKFLIEGLKLAILLLNKTKIDHINSQIREHQQWLLMTTTTLERRYYTQREQHMVSMQLPVWLESQPTVSMLRRLVYFNKKMGSGPLSDTVYTDIFPENEAISRFVAGFMLTYLKRTEKKLPTGVFSLDERRIKSIRRRFARLVYRSVVRETDLLYMRSESTDKAPLRSLLMNRKICSSPLYKLLEMRLLSALASEVLNILDSAAYASECQTEYIYDRVLVNEVSTMLLLHWTSAGHYYQRIVLN